jgi:hypothetical protein
MNNLIIDKHNLKGKEASMRDKLGDLGTISIVRFLVGIFIICQLNSSQLYVRFGRTF